MSASSPAVHPPLKRTVLAALSGPSIPMAALSLPLVVYLPEYYSGALHLNLAVVGTVFMLVRLVDIVFDPIIGALMDSGSGGKPRYRLWLLAGAPLVMLGVGMLFMAREGVGGFYLGLWLVVAYAGWSVVSLAQLALAANISQDYNERSRIYGWWQSAFLIGMLAVMILPRLIFKGQNGMTGMAWLVIIMMPVFAVFTALMVRERPVAIIEHRSTLMDYFRLFRRKIVRQLIATELLFGLSAGIASTLILFFFTRVKGIDRGDVSFILITHFVMALIATPLWARLAMKIGKHRALGLSGLVYFLAQTAMMFTPQGNLIYACVVAGVTGSVLGSVSLLPRAMMADISDVERLESGADRTGLFFALLIGTWKIGQALSVGIMFVALEMIGFHAAAGSVNLPSSLAGLSVFYTLVPAALSLAGGLFIWRFPLTAARHDEVRIALGLRESQGDGLGAAAGPGPLGDVALAAPPVD